MKLNEGQPARALWVERVQAAIEDVSIHLHDSEEIYLTAMMICSSDRMLLLEFWDEWRSDSAAEGLTEDVALLMNKALEALRRIDQESSLSGEKKGHLAEMINNTESRVEIANILAKESPRATRLALARQAYAALGDTDLAVAR